MQHNHQPLLAASKLNFWLGKAKRSGARHWFKITGLCGWQRAQMGMPAFGRPDCVRRQPSRLDKENFPTISESNPLL
jgi:hypothetical protein